MPIAVWVCAAALVAAPARAAEPVSPPISAELQAATQAEDPAVRQGAMRKLSGHGQPAVPMLMAGLKDPETIVRWAAIGSLERIENADVVPALLATLPSGDARMDARIYFLLARRGDRRALDALILGLEHGNTLVRTAAAAGLQRAVLPGDEARLAQATVDAAPAIVMEIAIALGQLQTPAAAAVLGKLIVNPNPAVQQYAAENLSEMYIPEATTILLQHTEHPSGEVRAWVFDGLVRHGGLSASEALLTGITSDDDYVRQASAHGLGRFADARSMEALLGALQDDMPQVRWTAADSLGHFANPTVHAQLRVALEDSNDAVRRAAATSLLRHNDSSGVPVLIEGVRHPNTRVSAQSVQVLTVFSGAMHGTDYDAWNAWWQRLQSIPTPSAEAPEASS